MSNHRLELALDVAWSHMGMPYRWGGDDPIDGYDCSGLMIEVLRSVGLLPRTGDWTAAGLFAHFQQQQMNGPGAGRLVFWQNGAGKIVHVELCLDSTYALGASGGNSNTNDEDDAAVQNAYVKIRPIAGRFRQIAGYVDPFIQVVEFDHA